MGIFLKVVDFLEYGVAGLGLAVLVVLAATITLVLTKKKLDANAYKAIRLLAGVAAFVFVGGSVFYYVQRDPREQLSELVADRMEHDVISVGSGKRKLYEKSGVSAEQAQEGLLRRAVFMNVYYLRADKGALKDATTSLKNRGIEFSDSSIEKISDEFAHILKERYRWLMDVAIPALQRKEDELARNPQLQEDASVSVELPETYQLLKDARRTTTVNNLKSLKNETEFIKRHLK